MRGIQSKTIFTLKGIDMKLAIVHSRASFGMKAPLVTVEAHLSYGLVAFNIVGLPETAVKESKHRVRSALLNTHFEFPIKTITVNLAPADIPKEGGRFDLPIALGILAASGQIPAQALSTYEFIGELALSGEIRAIHGVLPVVMAAIESGRQLIVPTANAKEAGLVQHSKVLSAQHLLEVCAFLKGEQNLPVCTHTKIFMSAKQTLDLIDVRGQPHAKRALEICAAGRHSLLFVGPPGTGKTMLASRLPSILPPLNDKEALEVAAIASISSNGFDTRRWKEIPFRSPHHTSSSVAMVGGGRPPKPGEISLSHRGILFLDELPEFHRHVLESLREPLESGLITISRAAYQTIFPAQFQLIAAMNPCPCGYAGSTTEDCRCTQEQIKRYLGKISGPLLDRMDMHVELTRLMPAELIQAENIHHESSEIILKRVLQAHTIQINRQKKFNADLPVVELERLCQLDKKSQQLLNQVMKKFNLSARAYHRICKVSLTIADLEGLDFINEKHISESLNCRWFDRARIASI